MAHAHRWVDAGGGTKRCSVKSCAAVHHTHQPVANGRGIAVCAGCGAYLGTMHPGQVAEGEPDYTTVKVNVVPFTPKARKPRAAGKRGSR